MQFVIPKFIEQEAKILGSLTWKQIVIVGIAIGFCVILYFILPFSLFIIAAIILVGGSFALAIIPIGGRSLPVVLTNFVKFTTSPKVYLWKKHPISSRKPKKYEKEESDEESSLEFAGKSMLKKLSESIERKTK